MTDKSGQIPAIGAESFDAQYYAKCCGKPYARTADWLQIFDRIAERIVQDIRPARVLDAGCALGLLVESLRARGVEACGVDLSTFAIANVHESVCAYCWQGSVADELSDNYDLIVCLEVLEHMPQMDAEAAIANFCRHSNDVLFSSSPLDYREATHVNVHPVEYWAEQFARQGFYRDVDFDASFLTSWAVRFRKGRGEVPRLVRDYESRYAQLLLERNELRAAAVELQGMVKGLDDAQRELAQARNRIFHMERSVFWKLRKLWARISGQGV